MFQNTTLTSTALIRRSRLLKRPVCGQTVPSRLGKVGSNTAKLRFTVGEEVGESVMKEAVVREKKFHVQNCSSKMLNYKVSRYKVHLTS